MAMSPRLLRPRQTGFNPRSISGLALWLDGADSSSLYTSDAGPVTAVSSPLGISGCALWLDGSDSSASSMTLSGSLLETWKDKSGNGRNFTAAGSARPTLTSSAINSKSAVTFNGSSTTMTGNTAAQDVIRNIAGYTTIAVLRPSSIAAGERFAFGVGTTVLFRFGQTDSRLFIGGRRGTADALESVTDTAGTLSSGSPVLLAATVNHAAQSLTGLRGGAVFSSDTTYMGSGSSENLASAANVGTQGGGTYGFWNGEIAELIVFNTALSTTDRARVEAYLAAKWGISGVHAQATATSDPVGYWGDKSGNNRHATQATGANRPRASTAGINSRRSVQFLGGNTELLSLGNLSSAFSSAGEVIVVFSPTNDSSYGLYETRANSSYFRNANGLSYFGTFSTGRQAGIAVSMPTSGAHIASMRNDNTGGATQVIRLDGAQVFAGASVGGYSGGDSHVLGNNNNAASDTGLTGFIAEVVAFPRILTTSERQRVERYLASKWGITLAPQVSNLDAQDWINRVYANGGTVSTATAVAVNTFCDAIDFGVSGVSIRDRFYRLNLFCGGNLVACLVPLYRGPSRTGTQYGNTTDTNNGPFVSNDYTERGTGSGLLNTGSKYLATGFATNTLSAGNRHLAAYETVRSGATFDTFLGSESAASVSQIFLLGYGSSASQVTLGFGAFSASLSATSTTTASFWLGVNDPANTGTIYRNGVQDTTGTTTVATPTSSEIFVFGLNRASTIPAATNFFGGRLGGYSIGLSMTSSQAAAYYTAMQAFQTALTRNV